MPEACVKGESFTTSVTFTNISEHALSCSGDDPARLAVLFQAVDSSDSMQNSVPDLRYPLPEDVGVGAAQTCRLVLQAPPTTGAYRLYVGIVSSQFVWFLCRIGRGTRLHCFQSKNLWMWNQSRSH